MKHKKESNCNSYSNSINEIDSQAYSNTINNYEARNFNNSASLNVFKQEFELKEQKKTSAINQNKQHNEAIYDTLNKSADIALNHKHKQLKK